MLKKINRGLTRKDFEASRKVGKMYQSPLFGVSVIKQDGVCRVGFVISKKISKKAVERNKIRRRLAEVIKNKMPIGLKIIVLAKKNILEADLEQIRKCWEMIYEKISAENSNTL